LPVFDNVPTGTAVRKKPREQPQLKSPSDMIQAEKTSTPAVRFFQALLLLVGVVWAILWSRTYGLDDLQIPGFLIAMSISWWLTPEIRSRALKLGLVDKPGEERRIHKVPIPRLGGVAIYISVMVTVVALIAICGRFPKDARGSEGGLAGIAVGGTLIFVLGLLDDLESLPAKAKLLVQVVAGCVAYSLGVRIKQLPIPESINIDWGFLHLHGGGFLQLGPFSAFLTVLWLVGIANAVNLIDGMDGLAAGVSAISAMTIWAVALSTSLHTPAPYAALAAAVLAGALLGFLRWNFNPARIFLGDSGAYLTGFILGAISITGVIKLDVGATVLVPTVLLAFLVLFFPILDTSWAIVRRLAKRKSIFEPDAGHIHHRLLKMKGMSQKKVAYLIYAVSGLMGLIAAAFVNQLQYFACLAATVIVMAVFFAEVLNRHRQRKNLDASGGDDGGIVAESAPPPAPPGAEASPPSTGADQVDDKADGGEDQGDKFDKEDDRGEKLSLADEGGEKLSTGATPLSQP
jgi:UDP-GlcNAc:undecaprenyl-phosphate GlcNAc-1-phosphate transferase